MGNYSKCACFFYSGHKIQIGYMNSKVPHLQFWFLCPFFVFLRFVHSNPSLQYSLPTLRINAASRMLLQKTYHRFSCASTHISCNLLLVNPFRQTFCGMCPVVPPQSSHIRMQSGFSNRGINCYFPNQPFIF